MEGFSRRGLMNAWPVRAAQTVLITGARPVWERVVGASLTEQEIRKRASETAVSKAEIGVSAVHEGMERDDPALRCLGEAMVAKAFDQAESNQHDLVVQAAVAEVVSSLPIRRVSENPYIPQPVAERVDRILGE